MTFIVLIPPLLGQPHSIFGGTRIFNVRTFLCVRVHTGVGNTDESAHFDSDKLLQIFLVLLMRFEPLVMESTGSRGRRSSN